MTEALTLIDIGDVNFDHRHIERRQRVMDGNRGVRISARIEDEAARLLPCLMDPVHKLALMVGLAADNGKAQRLRPRGYLLLDIGKRGRAVNMRLAQAEQVQVRPVEHMDRLY